MSEFEDFEVEDSDVHPDAFLGGGGVHALVEAHDPPALGGAAGLRAADGERLQALHRRLAAPVFSVAGRCGHHLKFLPQDEKGHDVI